MGFNVTSYEMGVMMYRANTLIEVGGYNLYENFSALFNSLDKEIGIDIENLKDGFMAEAFIDGVGEDESVKLFSEYLKELDEDV